jgi:hypothetical protein
MLVGCNEQICFARMKSIALKSIERTSRHEGLKDGVVQTVTFVTKLSSAVGAMLTPNPPAAMAWSGICAVLPVCSPFYFDKDTQIGNRSPESMLTAFIH